MNLQIRTRDNIVFNFLLNTASQTYTRSGNSLDLDIIEKSFTPGAKINGNRRLASKNFEISLQLFNGATEDDDTYREKYNDIAYYASRAEYIEDTDNNTRMRVELENVNDRAQDPATSVLRSGWADISFIMLDPFWEDTVEQVINSSGTEFTLAINNSGFIDTPARFEIATSSICELIQIFITDPVRGIEVRDLIFGSTATLDDYVIDNNNGKVLLGDDSINRNSRIASGSGFFYFPVGNFTLNLKFSVAITIAIKYRRRFFV